MVSMNLSDWRLSVLREASDWQSWEGQYFLWTLQMRPISCPLLQEKPDLQTNLYFDPSRRCSSDNTNCPLSPSPGNSPSLLTFENIYCVRMQRPTRVKNSEQCHVLYLKITEKLWQLIWDLKVCMCSAGLLLQSLKHGEYELIFQLVFEFQIFAFVFSLQLFQCPKEPCMVLK